MDQSQIADITEIEQLLARYRDWDDPRRHRRRH